MMRVYALYCAILIYALFSSPTPDAFGWAEMGVAGLLLIAIHPVQCVGAILQKSLPSPLGFHRLFILCMMSIPLIIGSLNSHAPSDIARDIIPLACLILPFCFMDRGLKRLPIILTIAGACFATRYLMIALPSLFTIGHTIGEDSLLYLANSPLVPFACLYGFNLLTRPDKTYLTQRLIGLCIIAITFIAMAVMIQRAPIVLSLLGCSGILIVRFGIAPIKTTLITLGIFILLVPTLPVITQISDGFIDKTLTVGANNRINEFNAAISSASVLGNGWGTIWQSPAVGDYWIRYTHNMTSYYWLKSGIIGAVLSIAFIVIWIRSTIKIALRHDFATGIALFIPLVIHMTLYTGYKTFDFALLILMVYVCLKDRPASLSSTAPSHRNLVQQGV